MSTSLDYEMMEAIIGPPIAPPSSYADGATPDFEAEDDEEEDDMEHEDDDDEEEAHDELAKPAVDDNDVRRHLRGTRQLRHGGWKHGHLGHHGGWKHHGYGGWPHHGGHHGVNRRCHGRCFRWSPRRQRCVIRRRCMW